MQEPLKLPEAVLYIPLWFEKIRNVFLGKDFYILKVQALTVIEVIALIYKKAAHLY